MMKWWIDIFKGYNFAGSKFKIIKKIYIFENISLRKTIFVFLVSRPTGRWDLRSHVCPFVRSSVTLFLGNRSLLFSETLQLVRACKQEKNVPSAFLIIFTVSAILAKNWPKLAFWLYVWKSPFKGWKSLKNLNVCFWNRF